MLVSHATLGRLRLGRKEVAMFRQLSLVILVFALVLAPSGNAAAGVDALGWLAGCWEGEGGGGRNQECWMAPEGGMMLGVSRVLSERDTQFEFLRLAPHGDRLALLASPGGKPAVAFLLVESVEGLAVFANPEHDFPQRITYRRDGDALTARVEAEHNGEWRGFDIAWRRTSGGWPGRADQQAEADLQQQVREVETAFARTMADRDHDAFAAFLAEEAVFVSAATARGREQVAAQWQRFFETPEAPFSWRPETVEVLDSGTLALSSGPVHDVDGQLISRFTSVWRREASGEWRIVFDKGQRVCEEPAPRADQPSGSPGSGG